MSNCPHQRTQPLNYSSIRPQYAHPNYLVYSRTYDNQSFDSQSFDPIVVPAPACTCPAKKKKLLEKKESTLFSSEAGLVSFIPRRGCRLVPHAALDKQRGIQTKRLFETSPRCWYPNHHTKLPQEAALPA